MLERGYKVSLNNKFAKNRFEIFTNIILVKVDINEPKINSIHVKMY
jgi:hypothetical protein